MTSAGADRGKKTGTKKKKKPRGEVVGRTEERNHYVGTHQGLLETLLKKKPEKRGGEMSIQDHC